MKQINLLFASFIKTYPPRQEGECLVSTAEDAYTHAKDFLEGIQLNQDKSSSTSKYRDHREKNLKHVVSISQSFFYKIWVKMRNNSLVYCYQRLVG